MDSASEPANENLTLGERGIKRHSTNNGMVTVAAQRKDKIPELQTVKPAEVQVYACYKCQDYRLEPAMTEEKPAVWSAFSETQAPCHWISQPWHC